MFKRTTKILFIVFLCSVFATAFMVSSDLVDGIFTTKTFYFYLVFISIIVSFVIYLISSKPEIKFTLNKLDIALLIFYGYSFIRLIFTEQIPLYNARIVTFTFLIILYFIFKQIFFKHSKENLGYTIYFLLFSFLTAGLLQGFIGLLQTYEIFGFSHSNEFIAVGSFGNPAPYAGFIESVLPFAFGITQLYNGNKTVDKLLKKYALLTFLVLVLVLPTTETRGAWVASLGGVVFVLIVKYNFIEKLKLLFNKRWKKVAALICLGAAVILLFTSLYYIRPASAFGRLLIWKVSANMIADYPLFGIGYDSFGNNYNNYQAQYFAEKERSNFEKYVAGSVKQAHNEYIEIAVEFGFYGLLIFLGLLRFVLISKSQYDNYKNILFVSSKACIFSIMIGGLFSYPLQILPSFINFIFLLAILSSFSNYYNIFTFQFIRTKNLITAFSSILIFILIVFFANREIRNYNSLQQWQIAKLLSLSQSYSSAIPIYKQEYTQLNKNGNFLLNFGGTLSLAGEHKKAIQILEKGAELNTDPNLYLSLGNSYSTIGDLIKAKECYLTASNMVPNQFFPKYLLAKLYYDSGDINRFNDLANEIIVSKPKIASSAILQMKSEIKHLMGKQQMLD